MSDLAEILRARSALLRAWHSYELGREVPARLDYLDTANDMAKGADEIDRLQSQLAEARKALAWMDRNGGLGFDVHDEITRILALIGETGK